MPTQNKTLPLLVGHGGFPESPLDEDSPRGMLVVRGKPHSRDGIVRNAACVDAASVPVVWKVTSTFGS